MKSKPENLDATDGLAAALCHHFQRDNKITKLTIQIGQLLLNKTKIRLSSKL